MNITEMKEAVEKNINSIEFLEKMRREDVETAKAKGMIAVLVKAARLGEVVGEWYVIESFVEIQNRSKRFAIYNSLYSHGIYSVYLEGRRIAGSGGADPLSEETLKSGFSNSLEIFVPCYAIPVVERVKDLVDKHYVQSEYATTSNQLRKLEETLLINIEI